MRLTTTSCLSIGLLLDFLAPGYQRDILEGVSRAVARRGANLLVFVGGEFADEQLSTDGNIVFQSAKKPAVDGVVAPMSTLTNKVGPELGLRILRGLGVPSVSLGLTIPGVPSIGVDNRAGLRSMCHHLAEEHGFRRFALIAGPEQNEESQQRIATCREALAELGVTLTEDRVTRQGFLPRCGRDGIKELFERRGFGPDNLDAIICANDLIAEGALLAMRVRGVRVPEDIAVTGFDDVDGARYLVPPLSTVRQPLIDLGAAGARALLQSLDGLQVPLNQTLPSSAIIRASCGCVAAGPKKAPALPSSVASRRALDGALQLLGRRDVICTALSRAAQGQLTAEAGWEGRWVMALFSDLGDHKERRLLSLIEGLLCKLAEKRGELELCQELLGVLRDEALSALDDMGACRRLEDILHAARLTTSGAIERLEVNRRLHTTSALYGTLSAVARVMRAVGQPSFWERLAEELRELGIHTCFVSRYVGGGYESSSYVFGFSDVEPLPAGLAGKVFPASALLPDDLIRRPRDFALLVRPIFTGQRALGTLLLSLTANDLAAYEPFASLLALELGRGA